MVRFTPGPWKAGQGYVPGDKRMPCFTVSTCETRKIGDVVFNPLPFAFLPWGEENEFNAKLIAAAPSMLACLESVRLTMHTAGMPVAHIDRVIQRAKGLDTPKGTG